MKPGRELDRLVALALGKVEGADFGDLGQHNWEWNEHSEYNTYYCVKCGASSEDWADESKLPKDGCHKNPVDYSTSKFQAIDLWGWLEENHPWRYLDRWGSKPADLLLGRKDGKPAVYVMRSYWDSSNMDNGANLVFIGESYPHAIVLAVVEAAKAAEKLPS